MTRLFLVGDSRKKMAELSDKSVNIIIGSPPYYDARTYGDVDEIFPISDGPLPYTPSIYTCPHPEWEEHVYKMHNGRGDAQKSAKYSEQPSIKDNRLKYWYCKSCRAWRGQLGHEPTSKMFIEHLMQYYDIAQNVLRDDGLCFVVIGDTMEKGTKSWIGIPGMFMQAMKERGWVCRSDIIWQKGNPKPENVNDRPAIDYEHIFMFAKKCRPRFYVNKHTKKVVQKLIPKDKLLEGANWNQGEDWYWKHVTVEEGGQPKKNWKKGKDVLWLPPGPDPRAEQYFVKTSYWKSYDYYYEQQYVPYADSTIIEALSKYLGKAVKDYEKGGAENASNVKRRVNQSTLESLIDLGVLDNINLKDLGVMPPVGGVKKAGGDNASYSGHRPDYKWGRIMPATVSMNTARYSGGHFAVFPLELVELLLNMGCPPAVCRFCGLPRVRLTSEVRLNTRPGRNVGNGKSGTEDDPNKGFHRAIISKYRQAIIRNKNAGFAECECKIQAGGLPAFDEEVVKFAKSSAKTDSLDRTLRPLKQISVQDMSEFRHSKWTKPVVLDFWGGSGSTCVAADRMGFDFIYVDRNAEYAALAERRMKEDPWLPGLGEEEQQPKKIRNERKLEEFGIVVD